MSSPKTIPLESLPVDYYEDRPLSNVEGTGHSVSTQVSTDNSVNKHLPYLWFNGVLAALALGLSISSVLIIYSKTARDSVSENHWRDVEVKQGIMQKHLEDLEHGRPDPGR